MSLRRTPVIALSLVGLAAVAAFAWYANRGLPGQSPVAGSAPAPAAIAGAGSGAAAPVLVEAHTVRTQVLADDVSAVGSLVSNESVVLRPEVPGRIAAIRFRDGAAVRRGDVLVELDAAVQRAELQQARANLTLAESNFRRSQDLFARKFVSQSSLDNARSQLEVARAGVALAQARLERMQIRAPFDGIVGIRSVSPGDYVKDGDAMINLEDIATLKLDFRLPEQYLDRVRRGQVVEVSSDVLPGERFEATVDAIDPLVDAQGRAVRLRANLANPDGRLRPGVFARVRLILDERSDVVVVPEAALVPAPGNVQYVYRVVDDKAQRVEVRTGVRRSAMVEIVDGLPAGAVVVTAGQLKLRDGAPVRLATAPGGVALATD
ncbi:MAG TPA: efflux RND transporter periplasmic adaptor subunit [Thauera sp.]|uniref:efflux RND transporter periplasmic adaptor subunit n=1 Tax=Thauera sp. TaxID=1905334 RepID=UPI002C74EFAA|nr:efflux RND transporter periplasmic adaptor subunit [Thauera sp.]HRP24886.1 efflux RND transporter periplasmic adaptor subunit [Thauera sp.]HRP65512.1 efflux RND transporter periplasmic adaptor subunit [Thauera sp.]